MNVQGMNRYQGTPLDGIAHIRQSIVDILTTPLGSRVMRRDYGSLVPRLVDQPLNDLTLIQTYAAAVTALLRWEPRIRISRLQLHHASMTGQVTLGLDCMLINTNKPFSLEVAISMGAMS